MLRLIRRFLQRLADLRRSAFAGQAAIYLFATAIYAAIPLLLLPVLARWLGPAELGKVGVFVALVNTLGVLVGLSTHGPINVVYHRDGPQAMPPQAGAALGVALAMTAALAMCGYIFRDALAALTGIETIWLWTILVASLGQFCIFVCLSVFQAKGSATRYAILQVSFALLNGGLALMLVGGLAMGYEGRAIAQAVAALVIALIGLTWLTVGQDIDWRPRSWPIVGALAFGVPLIPHAFGAVAMVSVDRLALSSTVGAAATGWYFVGVQLASIIVVAAASLNQAWLPWLYGKLADDSAAARIEVVRASWLVFAGLAVCGLLLAALAPWLVPIVAGPGYDPAIAMAGWLGPASAFSAMYFFVAGYLFYTGRTGLLSIVTVCVAAVQAALSFWLAHLLGAIGVAMATFASALLYFMVTWAAANHVHPMPWFSGLRGGSDPD